MQRELKRIHYVNKQARSECAIRARCTNGKFRAVSRLENEAVLDRMQARLAKRPSLQQWMNQGAFLMCGLYLNILGVIRLSGSRRRLRTFHLPTVIDCGLQAFLRFPRFLHHRI